MYRNNDEMTTRKKSDNITVPTRFGVQHSGTVKRRKCHTKSENENKSRNTYAILYL